MMPDMTAGLNSDRCLPAQLNIKHSNERAKKMASLSNMATSWQAREKKKVTSLIFTTPPPHRHLSLVNSSPHCMRWSSPLLRFVSGCADYWGDKGRRGDRWRLLLSDEKITKAKSSFSKKKKKLSVGKRKPPKHTYTRLHTVLHSYQCPEPFESPLERWSPGKYPGPPNCDFSPFPPVVGYVQQHFQLLSDCLISIFLISEHQEY